MYAGFVEIWDSNSKNYLRFALSRTIFLQLALMFLCCNMWLIKINNKKFIVASYEYIYLQKLPILITYILVKILVKILIKILVKKLKTI